MNVENLFDQPGRRRWWLLAKALEAVSLDEALRLVQAAEDFIKGSTASGQNAAIEAAEAGAPDADVAAEDAVPEVASEALAVPAIPVMDKSPTPVRHLDIEADAQPASGVVQAEPEVDPPERLTVEIRIAEAAEVSKNLEVSESSPVSTLDELVVMATADDVVRYLRQRDDVVVSAGEGAYLVNGRFRITLDELLERANGMRARQKLPSFTLIPLGFGAPAAKCAANGHSVG